MTVAECHSVQSGALDSGHLGIRIKIYSFYDKSIAYSGHMCVHTHVSVRMHTYTHMHASQFMPFTHIEEVIAVSKF